MSDTHGNTPEATPREGLPESAHADLDASAQAIPMPAAAEPSVSAPASENPAVDLPAPVAGTAQAPMGAPAPRPQHPAAAPPFVYGTPAYPQPGAQPAYGHTQAPHAPQGNVVGQAPATAPIDPTAPQKASTTGGAGRFVGILVAAALVGGGAGLGGAALWSAVGDNGSARPAAGPSTAIVGNANTATQTTAIAAKVVPSVVTLDVSSRTQAGSGSGVILSSDGYVLTNTHVVTLDGAERNPNIRATTSDGRIFTAKVVGLDPLYDLAVLKLVDASGLTPIEFADSSELNVGDTAIAVGAPLGLSNTVTDGIVSALNRSIEIASSAVPERGSGTRDTPRSPNPSESLAPDESQDPENNEDPGQGNSPWFFDMPGQDAPRASAERISIAVIQTDAAINPGNSGGALVNGKGELIGINVAIATASGTGANQAGSIGVGFAIPSNIAERVAAEIIESGVATHGLLGATVRAASSEADATVSGALIHELTPGGAAEAAGLQPGDVVTEFNGSSITSAVDLTAQVRAVAAGETVELTYLRGTSAHTVEVTLGSL